VHVLAPGLLVGEREWIAAHTAHVTEDKERHAGAPSASDDYVA